MAAKTSSYTRFALEPGDLIVRLVTWAIKGTDEASAD